MASRRLTKSAVDWVKFAERVPEEQKQFFQAFKARSDAYLRKAFSLPEAAPAINWDFYKKRGLPAGLVEQFQQKYSSLTIPYPKENVIPTIDAQEKESEKQVASFMAESNKRIEKYKKELLYWDNLLPWEYMTLDDFKDAFPELAFDPLNRPTAWPHQPDEQTPKEQEAAVSTSSH